MNPQKGLTLDVLRYFKHFKKHIESIKSSKLIILCWMMLANHGKVFLVWFEGFYFFIFYFASFSDILLIIKANLRNNIFKMRSLIPRDFHSYILCSQNGIRDSRRGSKFSPPP